MGGNEKGQKLAALLTYITIFVLYRTVLHDRTSYLLLPPLRFSHEATAEKQANVSRKDNVEERTNSVTGMKLSILVTGRPGTGKSTLMSDLLGREVNRRSVEDLEVSSISASTVQIDGVSVRTFFWNSPGIYDGALNEENKVKKLRSLLDSIDLVIYAMRMDETRMRPEDTEIMQKLTQTFGVSLWRKGMFVLTFANRVNYLDDRQTMRRSKEHSAKRAGQWEERIREVLIKEGVSDGLLTGVPYVPVGHSTEPWLFAGEEPWRSHLMTSINARVSGDTKTTVLNRLYMNREA